MLLASSEICWRQAKLQICSADWRGDHLCGHPPGHRRAVCHRGEAPAAEPGCGSSDSSTCHPTRHSIWTRLCCTAGLNGGNLKLTAGCPSTTCTKHLYRPAKSSFRCSLVATSSPAEPADGIGASAAPSHLSCVTPGDKHLRPHCQCHAALSPALSVASPPTRSGIAGWPKPQTSWLGL